MFSPKARRSLRQIWGLNWGLLSLDAPRNGREELPRADGVEVMLATRNPSGFPSATLGVLGLNRSVLLRARLSEEGLSFSTARSSVAAIVGSTKSAHVSPESGAEGPGKSDEGKVEDGDEKEPYESGAWYPWLRFI